MTLPTTQYMMQLRLYQKCNMQCNCDYQQCNIRCNYDSTNNAIYDAIMTLQAT